MASASSAPACSATRRSPSMTRSSLWISTPWVRRRPGDPVAGNAGPDSVGFRRPHHVLVAWRPPDALVRHGGSHRLCDLGLHRRRSPHCHPRGVCPCLRRALRHAPAMTASTFCRDLPRWLSSRTATPPCTRMNWSANALRCWPRASFAAVPWCSCRRSSWFERPMAPGDSTWTIVP